MNESEYLQKNGCKLCSGKVKTTTVCYSDPPIYEYKCEDCGHWGTLKQSNYQLTTINNISKEKYFEAVKLAKTSGESLSEVIKKLGGTYSIAPEPEFKQT